MLEAISKDIFLVKGMNRGRFPYSHSILILSHNKKYVLIDTGCGIETLKKINEKFNIEYILNSHGHPDHCAGNWVFNNQAPPIYVPKEGFKTAGNLLELSNRFTEPGYLAEYWRGNIAKLLKFNEFKPTHTYEEKSQFEIGNITLQPIHTPGHTTDHYCLYEPHHEILFSFDIDFTSFGPWYGHRESSISEFKKSIDKLKDLPIKLVVSGHREIVSSNFSRHFETFYHKFKERDGRILALLEQGPKFIEQLVNEAPIYGSFPYAEVLLRYWEEQMIKKHLKQLIKKDLVIIADNNLYEITT
ncbi:MAG: MBL fold metallo-hydrolase [Promethearchaeota archaeon]